MALIEWKELTSEHTAAAAENAQIIVMYFGDKKNEDQFLKNADVDGLVVAESVVCFRVPKVATSDSVEVASESVIPVSPLLSKDLWKAYGVEEPDTFVVADRYGNKVATERTGALQEHVNGASKQFRAVRKDIRKLNEAAEAAVESKDLKTAIAKLHEAFALGVVGYKECVESAELYRKLMGEASRQIETCAGDVEKLKALAEVYAGSDVEKDINAAIKKSATAED